MNLKSIPILCWLALILSAPSALGQTITTTLFSNPSDLTTSGFYQNGTNNNPYLPGTHHGLLLNMASYWNDNFDAQLYVDYTSPGGTTTPHVWYRFSNESGYTGWYRLWSNVDDGAGSGLDADLIRGQAPQWTTSGTSVYTTNSGNVGIGTASPQSKLAVNGTITAKQMTVTQNGWPDYVFDSSYAMSSLDSVKAFVNRYHHLPEIPPSGEIESKGLDLGDMQKKQMQKIEELTLYAIDQDKQLKEQRTQIAEQKQQLTEQQQQLKAQQQLITRLTAQLQQQEARLKALEATPDH